MDKKGSRVISPTVKLVNLYTKVLQDIMNAVGGSFTFQTLAKLSFAIYVVNYFYIRYDFFSSRVHLPLSPSLMYNFAKRFTYTISISVFLSYFFHILFVAPFEALRRSYKIKTEVS